ncbi:MAG TPA: hypothetical protein VGM41_15375 [Chitinophagaceae bacterium]|jgi:hypothetical protein
MNSYVALWKPGDQDLFWHVGLSFDEFKQTTNDFHKLGYRITSLDVDDEGLFTAIWKRGDYAQFWVRVDSNEIDSQIKHFDKKGCRMAYIAYENDQVTMVFDAGTGDHFYCFGEDFEGFKKLDKKHSEHGLRIHWISIDDDPTISAIWRPGTGGQFWYLTASWSEFSALNDAHKGAGLLLSCLHKTHDPGVYIGVVHPGTGDQVFDFAVQHKGLVGENEELAKKGMELKVLRRLHYDDGGLFPDLRGFER